jgi:predicted acetyltransferase
VGLDPEAERPRDERDANFDIVQQKICELIQKLVPNSGIAPPLTKALKFRPRSPFWFIEDGGEFLGSLHLRHELANDYARPVAGHVRYGVRPSRRWQGIGTEMPAAAQAQAQTRALGHLRILMACRESNVASRRLIETGGGIFERTVLDPRGEGLERRYRIAV